MAKKTTKADYDRWEDAPGSIRIIKPKKTNVPKKKAEVKKHA